jgi:hypothetical protein
MPEPKVASFSIPIDGFGAGPGQGLELAPVLLGAGEPFFAGPDLRGLGYARTGHVASGRATHVVLQRTARP